MKRILTSIVVAVALSAPALAADMAPAYKAPPLMPAYSWTGFYIGANIGGAWSRQSAATDPTIANQEGQTAVSVDQDRSSVIGGVHIGYNYQFDPRWVVGVEGDWSWTRLDASATAPNINLDGALLNGGLSFSRDTKWLASIRGRLGWVAMPNMLLYFTGGAAWANSRYAATDTFADGAIASVSFNNTRTGYALGAGTDYALTNNWIIRAEYLYYHFGGESASAFFPGNTTPAAVINWDDLQIHEVRVGVSYKF